MKTAGDKGLRWKDRLLSPDVLVAAASLVALALLASFRDALASVPVVSFALVMVLFAVPGVLLARWVAGDRFPGPALLPVGIAFSSGIFGVLGVPILILHRSLNLYLTLCGAVLATVLVVAAARALRPAAEAREATGEMRDPAARWLWVPFLSMGSVFAFLSSRKVPLVDGDTWNYLAWVREYLNVDRLALYDPYFGTRTPEFSRVKINGWMLEQAALSRVSGIDPIELVLRFLAPTLIFVAFLAFYALARTLFKSERAALLAGCLYALFLLVYLDASVLSFGGEFLGRIVQDKGFARFVFLPVALCFALAYLEERRLRHLLAFGLLSWSVVSIHPIGLAIIGLSTAGLGLVHVAVEWRMRRAWTGATALGLALMSILLVPASYVLLTGKPLSSALYSADIGATDPEVLANMVFVRDYWEHIYLLGDGLYIMHPSLVLNPVILAGYALGVPFLISRLKGSLAARLLLGMLLVSTLISYVPQVATFVGNEVVAPGQLYRLSWPIPLAAVLALSWAAWETTRYAGRALRGRRIARRAARLLPLALVVVLVAAATPAAAAGIEKVYDLQTTPGAAARFDPIFRWMQRNIKKPTVVLAPDEINIAIPAYSANINVVSFRGRQLIDNLRGLERFAGEEIEVPQGARDVRNFYAGPTFGQAYEIFRRNDVRYVMVQKGGLDEQMQRLPGFVEIETPGERYALFRLDYHKLRWMQQYRA